MIAIKNIARILRFGALLLCLFAALPSVASDMLVVNPPVMVPQGQINFVGSIKVTFRPVVGGRIFYTLDGSIPTNNQGNQGNQGNQDNSSILYHDGDEITVDHSLTLKAIHFYSNTPSETVTGVFIRAQLPAPIASYGGKASFFPSVLCTLSVAQAGAYPVIIHYTLDGTSPDSSPSSQPYKGPFLINKTETLKSYATAAGYDNSGPMNQPFKLLDSVLIPIATPKGQNFATPTFPVHLKSNTPGSFVRYSVDPNRKALDSTDSFVNGDTVVIHGGNIKDTVYLRAQAFHSGGNPPSPVMLEKYVYLPAVNPPYTLTSGTFNDTTIVNLLSVHQGDTVRYVLDNSNITINSSDGSQPIHLSSGATIRAKAFHGPQPPSSIYTVSFTLNLTPPTFSQPAREFVDSLAVRITSKAVKPSIYYTLDGSNPTVKHGSLLDSTDTVMIRGVDSISTTTLKAIAVKDGDTSGIDSVTYTRRTVIQKLTAPTIDPGTQEFEIGLDVTLRTAEANAEIHYTLDSTKPTLASPTYGTTPVHLDSTATLSAACFPTKGALTASDVHTERYVLEPSQPTADMPDTGLYTNFVKVTLKTGTKGGEIRVALGSTPLTNAQHYDGKPILIASTTRLQAVTVLTANGVARFSSTLDLNYNIYPSNPSDTLQANTTRTLSGGYVFTNASDLPIIAKTHTTDIFGLVGFRDPSLALQLAPVQSGQVFKVTYTRPDSVVAGLYRYSNGIIDFITSGARVDLTQAGDYFTGVDTMPPTIALLSEEPKAGDSTLVKLSIKDNVSNPSCEIQSPGIAGSKQTVKPDAHGNVSVLFKMPDKDLRGLWFRAASSDSYNTSRFPADSTGKFYLSQLWGKLTTPSVLSLGRGNSAWDLAGFPIGDTVSIAWSALRSNNAGANLDGAVWNEPSKAYVYLNDSSLIKPGMAFWIGSRTPASNVTLAKFRAGESENDGSFRMLLHPGWNQVTSPSLDMVYWPVTTAAGKLSTAVLKAPYRYLPETDDFAHSDSLEPWRGYFVNYYSISGLDTTITLYTDPSKLPAAKTAAGWDFRPPAKRPVDLNLDFGRAMPLNLAAQSDAQDGLGAEDEPDLPAWKRGFAAWSQRGKNHLLSDVVHFAAGEALHWDIVVADAGKAPNASAGSGMLKVLDGTLPAGYQAWAVSGKRGMKFRLETGMEQPLADMAGDTLSIYAGPLEKLAAISEFASATAFVAKVAFRLEKDQNGRTLTLALPWQADVEVGVWSPQGRQLAAARPGRLGTGIYHLHLANAAGSQIAFLRIRLNGEKGSQEFSQKVVW